MPQQRPQSQFDLDPFTSLRQFRVGMSGFALLVSLTLVVFLRRFPGWRILSLGTVVGMTFALYILNALSNFHVSIPLAGTIGAHRETVSLALFAVAFLGAGLWQRHEAWKALRRGDKKHHTRQLGVSYLEFLPIRQDLIYRVVDPVCAAIIGLVLRKLGFAVGSWVVFAAVCWAIAEGYLYEKELDAVLDVHDAMTENEVQEMAARHFAEYGAQAKALSREKTAGIPCGVDSGLAAQIENRKREAAAREVRR